MLCGAFGTFAHQAYAARLRGRLNSNVRRHKLSPLSSPFPIQKDSHLKSLYTLLVTLLLATSAEANEVSKAEWIKAMSTALPAHFCQPTQYFRQCFSVTQPECEQVALSATRICLEKHRSEIPEVLVQPRDGTRFGTIVGACSGGTYESTLIKKKISNARCNNPANFTQ